jgi:ADP-ribose pyrophosphatase YjhB (NUDIX family)
MGYPFNVRVYGLLINEAKEVLVADELIHERKITKFPGGGLEFGEGTIDAIKREMMEETATEVEVIEHFYTTDFFQVSAFNSKSQVLSIYYIIKSKTTLKVETTTTPFNFKEPKEGAISFRWISLKSISEEDFTFPIDKKVASLLKTYIQKKEATQ